MPLTFFNFYKSGWLPLFQTDGLTALSAWTQVVTLMPCASSTACQGVSDLFIHSLALYSLYRVLSSQTFTSSLS